MHSLSTPVVSWTTATAPVVPSASVVMLAAPVVPAAVAMTTMAAPTTTSMSQLGELLLFFLLVLLFLCLLLFVYVFLHSSTDLLVLLGSLLLCELKRLVFEVISFEAVKLKCLFEHRLFDFLPLFVFEILPQLAKVEAVEQEANDSPV